MSYVLCLLREAQSNTAVPCDTFAYANDAAAKLSMLTLARIITTSLDTQCTTQLKGHPDSRCWLYFRK